MANIPIYTDEEAISKICNVIGYNEFGDSIGYGTTWTWTREVDDPLYTYNINVGDVITRCSSEDLQNTNHPWRSP